MVLGAGVVALGTMRAYAKAGIRVVHLSFKSDDIAGSSRFAAETYVVPAPPQRSRELLDFIMKAPAEWSRSVLEPVNDAGVVFCSVHHAALSRRFAVATPLWSVLKGLSTRAICTGGPTSSACRRP